MTSELYTKQIEQEVVTSEIWLVFLHPEISVCVDGTTTARCYFGRYSAPEQENAETAKYKSCLFNDASARKNLASDYSHPKPEITTEDPNACGRCYFNRLTSNKKEDAESEQDHMAILEYTKNLRVAASFFLYPEATVRVDDCTIKMEFRAMGYTTNLGEA